MSTVICEKGKDSNKVQSCWNASSIRSAVHATDEMCPSSAINKQLPGKARCMVPRCCCCHCLRVVVWSSRARWSIYIYIKEAWRKARYIVITRADMRAAPRERSRCGRPPSRQCHEQRAAAKHETWGGTTLIAAPAGWLFNEENYLNANKMFRSLLLLLPSGVRTSRLLFSMACWSLADDLDSLLTCSVCLEAAVERRESWARPRPNATVCPRSSIGSRDAYWWRTCEVERELMH